MSSHQLLLLSALLAGPVFGHVAVNVQVGDPGYYGPLVVEERVHPVLVYPRPIVVNRGVVHAEPLYVRVPSGHAKHWSKHCARYEACARPVYFVRDDWYTREYVPHYREHHGHHDGDGRRDERGGDGHGDGNGNGDDQGHGNGHGNGHGHGNH